MSERIGLLGDVIVSATGGGTPPRGEPAYWNGNIPWATVKDFKDGVFRLASTEETITEDGLRNSSAKLVAAGTPIVCTRMAVGRVAIAASTVAINQDLKAISLVEHLDPLYFVLLVESLRDKIEGISVGSTVKGLGIGTLSSFSVFLPPKHEQEAIATVLSTIDKAINQTEALIAKQQRIKTALMQDLLTRGIDEHGNLRSEDTHAFKESPLGRIPVEWSVRNLKDLAEVFDPNPSHRYPPPVDQGVPIASTENFLGEDYFDLSGAVRVPASVYVAQYKRCSFDELDVVFARKGRIGLARLYGAEQKVFSHTVVIFKPISEESLGSFLLWAVRFVDFFSQIRKRMNSNSGVPTLGVEFLKAIPLRQPSIEEQGRIADTLEANEVIGRQLRASLSKLRRQKAALMQDLLTGKVSVAPLLEAASV